MKYRVITDATDLEIRQEFDLVMLEASHKLFLNKRIVPLLRDAIDAIEVGEYSIALRRIANALITIELRRGESS